MQDGDPKPKGTYTHFHNGEAVVYTRQCPECRKLEAPPNETWEEVADHQLDHDPTPFQLSIKVNITFHGINRATG